MTKYKWLTIDNAIKELKEGREVIGVGFHHSHIYLPNEVEAIKCLRFKNAKLRKPLTPEQIIKSGTPLLCGSTSMCNYQYALVGMVNINTDTNFMLNKLKFVINENGNYVTIKDGVIKEVLK